MSRFISADLASLGDVPAVDVVDFEQIKIRRGEFLKAALNEFDIDYDVTELETSPLMIAVARGGGYEETHVRETINEKIRALSLSTAAMPELRHIAATYYGIAPQEDIDAEGNVVVEDTERFRSRIALAPEAFSTAGPLGGYVFHALELDGEQDVADAWAYSEEDSATYTAGLHSDAFSMDIKTTAFEGRETGDPVIAPEILVIVLPTPTYGEADQALLDRVFTAETSSQVRPIGDNVRIEPAEVLNYTVDMVLTYARGTDPTPLVDEVENHVSEYVAKRRRVGLKSERLGIGGVGYLTGIEAVTLISPESDIGGGSKQAPNCTSVKVTAVESEGSWTQ